MTDLNRIPYLLNANRVFCFIVLGKYFSKAIEYLIIDRPICISMNIFMMNARIVLLLGYFFNVLTPQFAQAQTFTIHLKNKLQTIDNFGASGAWFSEGIGKYWAPEKKERMAELLFSKGFDASGNPLGIGLSAWRFNIGGGTAEQGDSSGISNPVKRVECFLSPNGTYDWTKQQGYIWFTKKAADYGVKDLIAFVNTPPVQFTKNGLGFRTEKDFITNLADDKYEAYANFLTTVIDHFNKEGLHFKYISPVNEPQWDWSNKFGQMNQEGTPFHNANIYKVAKELDAAFRAKKLSTKILLPEAAELKALYEGNNHASKQIQHFFAADSKLYVGNLKNLHRVINGHSYFTDLGDTTIIGVRKNVKDTAAKYKVPFWQSEYCMLGNGYKEGVRGRTPAIDCALFLAKMIHHDLTIAHASAWHFWNSFEPGSSEFDTRYYLFALKNNALNTEGDFTVTKNLWALGHFSRFIRPGMHRIAISRNDGLNELQAAQDLMLSAFANKDTIVITVINYTHTSKEIDLNIPGLKKFKSVRQYVTSADAGENMKPCPLQWPGKISLKPRLLVTVVLEK